MDGNFRIVGKPEIDPPPGAALGSARLQSQRTVEIAGVEGLGE